MQNSKCKMQTRHVCSHSVEVATTFSSWSRTFSAQQQCKIQNAKCKHGMFAATRWKSPRHSARGREHLVHSSNAKFKMQNANTACLQPLGGSRHDIQLVVANI